MGEINDTAQLALIVAAGFVGYKILDDLGFFNKGDSNGNGKTSTDPKDREFWSDIPGLGPLVEKSYDLGHATIDAVSTVKSNVDRNVDFWMIGNNPTVKTEIGIVESPAYQVRQNMASWGKFIGQIGGGVSGLLDKIMPKAAAVKTDNSALIFEPGTNYPAVGDDKKYLSPLIADLNRRQNAVRERWFPGQTNIDRTGAQVLVTNSGSIDQATVEPKKLIEGFNTPMTNAIELPVQDKQVTRINVPYKTVRVCPDGKGNMVACDDKK